MPAEIFFCVWRGGGEWLTFLKAWPEAKRFSQAARIAWLDMAGTLAWYGQYLIIANIMSWII